MMRFHVVQPWGRDKVRQSTMLSQHQTADAAFAEVDRLAAKMERTGVPTNAVELVVTNVVGAMIVSRSEMH